MFDSGVVHPLQLNGGRDPKLRNGLDNPQVSGADSVEVAVVMGSNDGYWPDSHLVPRWR